MNISMDNVRWTISPPTPGTFAAQRRNNLVDHISLSDPVTWVGVVVASFLIAGLRWVMRGGRRKGPPE